MACWRQVRISRPSDRRRPKFGAAGRMSADPDAFVEETVDLLLSGHLP
jgi:hypothetical protein